MTIRYYVGRNGKVEKEIVTERNRRPLRGEGRPARHQSETILNAYYELECRDGSRFRSNYTKNQIKRAHETATKRFNELGEEY